MPASVFKTSRRHSSASKKNSDMHIKVPLQGKVLAIALLLASMALMSYVAPLGMASAYYFKAEHYLMLWQRKPATLDQQNWQDAADAIAQAVQRHPTHPHYLLTQAKINEWGWYKGFKTAEQISENEQLYQSAIALRPTWPNAYADYAYFLAMVNFRITEAFDALKLANQYGPFIPETFARTFTIATHHWPVLNAVQKAEGLYALEKMVKNSYTTYQQAVTTTKQYKLERTFCLYLRLKKQEFPQSTQQRIEKDFCGVRR